jgi:hypothetical protein
METSAVVRRGGLALTVTSFSGSRCDTGVFFTRDTGIDILYRQSHTTIGYSIERFFAVVEGVRPELYTLPGLSMLWSF